MDVGGAHFDLRRPRVVQVDKVSNFGDILLALINIRKRTDV